MDQINRQISQELSRLTFSHREENFHHHSYDEDLLQYEYMKKGNVEETRREGRRMFEGATTGSLADNPVLNYKYLFVASTTLACRFCIEGGMDSETAFNLSDLYIRRMDKCTKVEEIFELHDRMFEDYSTRMKQLERAPVLSYPVLKCTDYIRQHLHDALTVKTLADELGLSRSYLSTLFASEMGVSLSDYVRLQRLDAAKRLLQYSEFSITEISEYLAFSSISHFSRVFKEYTGLAPNQYRRVYYRKHWDNEQTE